LRRLFGLRFLVEVALIADVATLAWYEDLSTAGIVTATAGAWLLVGLAEWLLGRRKRERPVATDGPPPAPLEPLPAPESGPPPPPAAEPVVTPAAPEPHDWNLWELERVVRESAGGDTARDEERSFLLMHLREFADPDGMLPVTFDLLVREALGDVLGVTRP
jgi:hypothetical protein